MNEVIKNLPKNPTVAQMQAAAREVKKQRKGKLSPLKEMEFYYEAEKAGINVPEITDEQYISKSKVAGAGQQPEKLGTGTRRHWETEAGVPPGQQLRTNVGGTPKARLKELGVKKSINLTQEGLFLYLAHADKQADGIIETYVANPFTAKGAKTEDAVKAAQMKKLSGGVPTSNRPRIQEIFDAVKSLDIAGVSDPIQQKVEGNVELAKNIFPNISVNQLDDVYIQQLYEQGYLEDADPENKDLNKKLNELPKKHRNRTTTSGRRLLDTKKGVPVVIGLNAENKLIYDSEKTRPYKLKISGKGRQALAQFYGGNRLGSAFSRYTKPDVGIKPTTTKEQLTLSGPESTISADTTRSPGGETISPNRREVSRKATGAIISRRDVTIFKEAMTKAVEQTDDKQRINLFKNIVEEARRIDPRVSLDSMQNIKDFMYFRGLLEADTTISDKLGPSKISDVDVPEYIRPTSKFYTDGFKSLDMGDPDGPLVINKISAPESEYVDIKQVTTDIDTLSKDLSPDKTVNDRTDILLDIIRKGGKKALQLLIPAVGATTTVLEEAFAATPTARDAPSEQAYDSFMEAAEKEELIPREAALRGRTMEEVKSRTSFMNQ